MFSILNAALVMGFLAVAIPPLVHIFSRKKFDEVDWAAMQFLQVSKKTRRKVFIEHFLLMLVRMAVIALVVLAFLAPTITSTFFNRFGSAAGNGERDVVILIDGSASMAYKHDNATAAEKAKELARRVIDSLRPGDRVAVFEAKQSLVPLLGNLSPDHDQARNSLELLNAPRGGVDWPACVQAAWIFLENGRKEREVVVIHDNQRYSWADENTLSKWDLLSSGGRKPGQTRDPNVWVMNAAADRPGDPQNMALDPILAGRGVASAGREVKFKSAIRFHGGEKRKDPGKVKLEIDGRAVGDVTVTGSPADGVMPIAFAHKFTTGSHLVTLQMDPDDLPGDNRQDFALEVLPSIPVLLIEGDAKPRGTEFLRDALSPAKDPTPGFLVRTAGLAEFTPNLLYADVKGPGTPPRVVVLANVPLLNKAQNEAVEKYLADGGAVLVTLGDRSDAAGWNRVSFRGGQGWLPARLAEIVGDDDPKANLDTAPRPQPAGFTHPAMEVFKEPLPGGLHTAYFPKRWKVDPLAGANGATGTAIATLTNNEPFLVERGVGRGRVLLCSVPLDNSWRTNFPRLPDFVRFAHEMSYYLAGAKAAERNLAPGQPIVFDPRTNEPLAGVTITVPDGPAKVIQPKSWPVVFDATRDPGAYKLTTVGGRTFYYAVRSDPQESVLTPCADDDKKRVADAVKTLTYITSPDEIEAKRGEGAQTREVWWVLLIIVLCLLGSEVWYTRALSRRGSPLE
ncbi:BatA domain-containing protein [Limnoglobus roseus]|uniref:VWA domain-containing protein n=1 Tax=Limnoglobus roseus TaxID=2598579 RepID=A0A5C1ALS6_9BACT|nr:BatA domain-containing protein [Limnoglobus roseus]QEL20171.1 VWA domain-containing protein [Limnoglobus roseus]